MVTTLSLQLEDIYFKAYPPAARKLASDRIGLLRELPIAFACLLLQQIREYDWRFPAERRDIVQQLSYLQSISDVQRSRLLAGFADLNLPPRLTGAAWASSPGEFAEQLSNYLWTSHQLDAFREASTRYLAKYAAAAPQVQLPARRLGIALIGKGVEENSYPLFRRLRPHGTYFTRVDPGNGLPILLRHVAARAAALPMPFDHWYIDGGIAEAIASPAVTTVSYDGLKPNRQVLLRIVETSIEHGIAGPEALLSLLHKLRPEEIDLPDQPEHAVLSHFELSLLTAGSGTQVFSTSFVQWATRELWRRAQPLTILARFAPRQRQRPLNELLSVNEQHVELDPAGSLIDADMGAFYMWLDQQRLPGAKEAAFLLWFENHSEALLISPTLPRNTESNHPVDLHWLFTQIT